MSDTRQGSNTNNVEHMQPRIDGYTAIHYQHTAADCIRRLLRLRHHERDGHEARQALAYWINALRRCRHAIATQG